MAHIEQKVLDAFTERSVACCNSCAGVPVEALADRAMAKAWLAWKLVEWAIKEDIYEPYQDLQEPIDIAIDFREHGHDFGELNALIDSFKL